jgi:colanic acid biosynthesis glycosyl transferase WcaI
VRILLVQRHYWPDVTATASMTRAIAARLAHDGHEVCVLSSMPSYNEAYAGPVPPHREMLDGHRVIRLRLPRERKRSLLARVWDMVAFPSLAAAHVLAHGRGYDIVVTGSAPPVVAAAAIRVAARVVGRPYVYHCQDINPEAALLSGLLHRGWRARLLARLDRTTVRKASATVVLSDDMGAALRSRGWDGRNLQTINNFMVEVPSEPASQVSPALRKPTGVFRVLFAGNLGLVQGLDVVLQAAERLQQFPDIQFAFVGAGAGKEELERRAGPMLGKSVVILPHQPLAVALAMMQEADLGLVSLAPGIIRVAYPSKTMAYLAAGCPVLAVVEAESELAGLISETGVGLTCPPGDPAAIADAILKQRASAGAAVSDRAQIVSVYRTHFGPQQALNRWSALFRELEASSRRR